MTRDDILKVFEVMKVRVKEWHDKGLTWFNLAEYVPYEETLENLVTRIIFHNYCIWHYIEGYQDPDSGKVNFVYLGGLAHNKLRNEVIELMDEKFCAFQKGTGKFNSETLGSVIDRISVLYIKMLHMKDSNDSRLARVEKQTQTLERCACELFEDMVSGERQVEVLSRFKTTGYNE
jgi:hypothetical protein